MCDWLCVSLCVGVSVVCFLVYLCECAAHSRFTKKVVHLRVLPAVPLWEARVRMLRPFSSPEGYSVDAVHAPEPEAPEAPPAVAAASTPDAPLL